MNIEMIGYLAGTLTTVAFAPQLIQVVKTKSTKDISLLMFIMFTIGVAGWIVYGLSITSYPVIIFNILTLVQSVIILGYKIKYN